jgi:hypothetical protein
MMRTALGAALAASLLLAACGDDIEDEPGTSTFTGNMTGAFVTPIAGPAVFGVTLDASANAGGFSLVLGDSSAARIALFAYTTPRPRAGTYEIVAPGFPAGSDTVFTGTMTYNVGGLQQQFEIRGGSITLARANHNRASGYFEVHAERTRPADGAQVSITGTFDAGQIPQVFPQ